MESIAWPTCAEVDEKMQTKQIAIAAGLPATSVVPTKPACSTQTVRLLPPFAKPENAAALSAPTERKMETNRTWIAAGRVRQFASAISTKSVV
jgi:hypothetical protein